MLVTLHGIHWARICIMEVSFIAMVTIGLGYFKLPKFLRHKQLVKGFPWGYYTDQVPKKDSGYFDEHDQDFMHYKGTEFGGLEGFGDYGEFSGFGELGEFGSSFFAGDAGV